MGRRLSGVDSAQRLVMTRRGRRGGKGDTPMLTAESCRMAETSTPLKSNYPALKTLRMLTQQNGQPLGLPSHHRLRSLLPTPTARGLYFTAQVLLLFIGSCVNRWPFWPTVGINMGFPGGASGKEPVCQCRRLKSLGSIPGLGRCPGGRAQ